MMARDGGGGELGATAACDGVHSTHRDFEGFLKDSGGIVRRIMREVSLPMRLGSGERSQLPQ